MIEHKKTIFLDIDGCVLKHQGNLTNLILNKAEVLPGVIEKFNEWEKQGYKIILTTGRKESLRELTEKQFQSLGLFFDQLIMGLGRGPRIVINDEKPGEEESTAQSICLTRNAGLINVKI